MRKGIKIFTGAIMGIALLASCQSNGYRIEGSGEALKNGDTLFLTTDLTELTPTDTIIVQDGKFTITGETDSTYFCLLFSASDDHLAMPFFVEPGTIKMDFTANEEQRRVSGTFCNREWQIVCDTLSVLSKEMNQLALQAYSGQLNIEEQAKTQEKMERLNDRFKDFIFRTGKKNISNEFGYFILTYYGDGLFNPTQCKELIDEMPEALRQRPAIKKMEEMLKKMQSVAIGNQISDFKMADINGNEVSILDEVKKNKLTVLDFWASWCGPCRQAMPQVVELYKQYHDKGLGIIGISLDNNAEAWKSAVDELGITWTQVSDLKGWENAIAEAFSIHAIPHMMVLDQEGRIVSNDIHGAELEQLISEKLQ